MTFRKQLNKPKMKRTITLLFLIYFYCHSVLGQSTVTLIPAGSAWKYLSNGSNQGTIWTAKTFNDASWSTGNAQLGYGDGDETTVIPYGVANNKYITYYFRKSFNITTSGLFSSLTLNIMRDDGAVVYLNGTEVARSNMPIGAISYTTLATTDITGTAESTYYSFTISPTLLSTGTNVLAVEIHQKAATNADVSFNAKLEGIQTAACGRPVNLTAAPSTTSAQLSWLAVSSATSYTVRYRPTGTTTYTTVNTTSPSLQLTGLTSGTSYQFNVRCNCGTSYGTYTSSVTFTTLPTANINDTLITGNDSWKYLDTGNSLDTIPWKTNNYNDAAWKTGSAEFGYGDGDEGTVVSYGTSTSARYITTYFRKKFTVSNLSSYNSVTLKAIRDDGVIIYINGTEVWRSNMPTGVVTSATVASATINAPDESTWYQINLNPSVLVSGNNIITAEVHQRAANSNDLSFNAKLYASSLPWVPVITRGPYIQMLTSTSALLKWKTDVSVNSRVQYGTSINYGSQVNSTVNGIDHELSLTGLSPATKYYYNIGTTTATAIGDTGMYIITAPVTGTVMPVRIWATGDVGTGTGAQTQVRNAYNTYTGNNPTHLWLLLGDNAYQTGTDAQYQSNVFNMYVKELRKMPLFPSPGNHDYGSVGYQTANALTTNFPYFNIFSLPTAGQGGGVASGTEKYYSFNYSNIHFICLDSYGALSTTTSPMYLWLQSDLAANTQRWTVVYFHHPPYTKGSHNSDTEIELINMRTNIIPLLENYHVDLVLSGHSHVNERSYLIKGHFGLANTFNSSMKVSTATNSFTKAPPYNGTIYAVCGTSGQNPDSPQSGYPMPCMFFTDTSKNCSMVIEVNGNLLSCKYLTSTGTIADQFTITKTGLRDELPLSTTNVKSYYAPEDDLISLTYYLENTSDVSVMLYDITGKIIEAYQEVPQHQDQGYYSYDLEMSHEIPSGIYIIRVLINGTQYTNKIMVAH